jgi:hypothetical protein
MAQQPAVFLGDASIPWRTTGHRWLGKKVRRIFFPGVETNAVIVAWVPEEGDDQALWHVRHPDGDEEDLEAYEVEAGFEALKVAPNHALAQYLPTNAQIVAMQAQSQAHANREQPPSAPTGAPEPVQKKIKLSSHEGAAGGSPGGAPGIDSVTGQCAEQSRQHDAQRHKLQQSNLRDTLALGETHRQQKQQLLDLHKHQQLTAEAAQAQVAALSQQHEEQARLLQQRFTADLEQLRLQQRFDVQQQLGIQQRPAVPAAAAAPAEYSVHLQKENSSLWLEICMEGTEVRDSTAAHAHPCPLASVAFTSTRPRPLGFSSSPSLAPSPGAPPGPAVNDPSPGPGRPCTPAPR